MHTKYASEKDSSSTIAQTHISQLETFSSYSSHTGFKKKNGKKDFSLKPPQNHSYKVNFHPSSRQCFGTDMVY